MSCGIRRILQFKDAIVFGEFRVFNNNDLDITNQCQYSWSTDGVCWTNWTSYSQYLSICKNIESDFYCRILLFDSFDRVSLNGVFTKCYTICLDSSNPFLQTFCDNENLFQPYQNLDCALQLQEQLSDSVICMLGIPIYYFRTIPEAKTADYTFKEYVLHNVESVKQIKLMIPDGMMPSSNPKFTEFDFDWESDWDVEISKNQFATAFGDKAFPKYNDFIYIPMMHRMWDVNAAYDEKNEGLMWRSTTWKLSLTKYNESTNVNTEDFDSLIDTWIVNNYEDTFGKTERNEQEREVGSTPITAPTTAATNLCDIFMEDAVRQQYTKNFVSIIDKQLNQKGTVVARNLYKFKNEKGLVTYQKGYCGEDGTLSFIIETSGSLEGEISKDIINIGPINISIDYNIDNKDFTIHFDKHSCHLEQFKTYMIICKWSHSNFCTEMSVIEYKHDTNIPIYRLRPEMYWFDLDNPVYEETNMYNNDFSINTNQSCYIHAYPLMLTNVKLYNTYLDKASSIKESIKYTTQNESCVINDLARPINSGHGYDVR